MTDQPRRIRTTTRIELSDDRGVFMISVAAELAEMHPQTLRMYEQRGLIEPKRSPKGTRLYSQADVERLKRIQEMTADAGMNLAGVERVFELEEQLAQMSAKVRRLDRRARELQQEVDRLEALRKSLRAEIVPYVRGGALVRTTQAAPVRIPVERRDGESLMQLDRFTIKSQEAIQAALRLAEERRNPQATPEHLLAVLLEQQEGIVAPVLRKVGADPGCDPHGSQRCAGGAADDVGSERRQRPLRRADAGAARRRARDAPAEGRVRLDRARAAVALRPQLEGRRRPARRRRERTTRCCRPSPRCAALTASPT